MRNNIWGEAVASVALAEAINGGHERATALIASIPEYRTFCLARVLASAANALSRIGTSTETAEAVEQVIAIARATEAYDGVLCAVRGSRPLLEELIRAPGGISLLTTIYERSRDPSLRDALGLPQPRSERQALSPREVEVLRLVAQGFRNSDVAAQLFISPKTVKTHLQHTFEKLDALSRTEAVVKAKNAGLL